VADIHRGYREPASALLRYGGKPAVGMGISTVSGGNVITMGDGLEKRLAELEALAPMGMEVESISWQPDAVTTALNGFLVSLAQAVGIVVVVLLVFMGVRSGLIIGFGASPPGAFADFGCEQVLVHTTADDASGNFYCRFFFQPDLMMGVLDPAFFGGGTAIAIGGVIIEGSKPISITSTSFGAVKGKFRK